MVAFGDQVEMNNAPNLLGAQTGVADDQKEGRARGLFKFCQFLKYLGECLKTQFGAIACIQPHLTRMICLDAAVTNFSLRNFAGKHLTSIFCFSIDIP